MQPTHMVKLIPSLHSRCAPFFLSASLCVCLCELFRLKVKMERMRLLLFFSSLLSCVFFSAENANVHTRQHSNNGLSINKKSISHSRPFVTI